MNLIVVEEKEFKEGDRSTLHKDAAGIPTELEELKYMATQILDISKKKIIISCKNICKNICKNGKYDDILMDSIFDNKRKSTIFKMDCKKYSI